MFILPEAIKTLINGLTNVFVNKEDLKQQPDLFINNSTTSTPGLMSTSDKIKLDTIPSTTTENNGQFLRVVDGAPSWTTISNAEEAMF